MIAERTHADDGPASAEATETALTAAQAKVNLAPDALTFTVTDDDARGVVDTDPITPATAESAALSVPDDGTTTTAAYTVMLSAQPSANVTIATVDALDRVDLAPTGLLVFSPTTWATAQTITMVGTPDDLDATTETETLTTVSGGEYAGQTVAVVMVTVTVAPTVSGDGMGTLAVDVVVRAVDAAQAAAGGPCAVGGVGSRAGGAAHGVVGEPPAVPVNVSNTDTPGERGTGDIGVQADGGCEPVLPGRHRSHGTR